MYKQLLIPATGAQSDAPVFQTALQVARTFGAHMEFLHTKIDVTDMVVAMSAGGMGGGGAVQGVVNQLEAESKGLEQKAWQAFTSFCTAAGIATGGAAPGGGLSADMAVETGNEAQWLAEYGRFADLVVVGRVRDGQEVALDVLEAALMDTGKPLLIAPAQAPDDLLKCVVIAWKDTPEAARAVAGAMPLIDHATEVLILTVTEGDAEREDSADRLQHSLRWHNPATTVRRLDGGGRRPVEVLLEAAAEAGATLLIMGGYSHSRLREVVFGGFTQHILKGAGLAVLMAH